MISARDLPWYFVLCWTGWITRGLFDAWRTRRATALLTDPRLPEAIPLPPGTTWVPAQQVDQVIEDPKLGTVSVSYTTAPHPEPLDPSRPLCSECHKDYARLPYGFCRACNERLGVPAND